MNYKKVVAVLVVLIAIILPIYSAGQVEDVEDVRTIGFSNWSKRFVFYQDLEAGIVETAEEHGIEVLVSDPGGDQATQQSHVENFVARNIDLLILIPIDSQAVVPVVEYVNDHNIPVITVDIGAGGGNVETHIASDNIYGGELAAHRMADLLDGSGEVAVITFPEITSTIEREESFVRVIEEEYPDIEIVARQSGDSERDRAMSVTEDFLLAYPNLDGIFAVNDMQGLGALAAVEAAGRTDISIIGFDAQDEAVEAMKAGTPYKGSVAQQPYLLGEVAVETAIKILDGESVDSDIPVEVKMVTPEDVQ